MTERTNLRMRHENARRRTLVVAEKQQLTPNYLAIRFTCDDFADFISASADDHVKLFLRGESGEGGRPPMRDYTPRAFDPAQGSFTIEFALHDDPGPATAWAIGTQIGDTAEIGGPRGSVVIPDDYDWYWLVGDEAAIPAIGRRLEELKNAKVTAFIAVAGAQEELPLAHSAAQTINWVHRPATTAADAVALLQALAGQALPIGEGFVWIAAESGVTKALREAVLAKGQPLNRIKAAGYWTAGMADTTAKFE